MLIYLNAVLIAAGVGAGGTALGAGAAMAVRSPRRKLSATLLGLAGGIVLALVLFDMIPESYELGQPFAATFGLAAGLVVMGLVSHRTHEGHAHDADLQRAHEIAHRGLMRTGLLLAAGMAVHNLPQGIALGSGLELDYIAGFAILLFLHNIPEGMAMAIPLRIGGVSSSKILYVALLTAIPTIAGAVLGVALSEISQAFIAGSMAFAAGAMLYLTVRELIPQAAALGGFVYVLLSAAAGFGAGYFVIWLLD